MLSLKSLFESYILKPGNQNYTKILLSLARASVSRVFGT